ncbi:WD40 repeat domain-containing serine/threonine-protein kinase [Acidobacteriia bacterium AH_259_A11_L15]|nr:WD40 repeat domain-containing serine/threonine-protein kinase [Acidobacteriia bacterium AH_259_A11_L15]
MKRCPQCQQEYPPNVKFCPRDGTAVEEIGGEADPLVGRLLGGRYRVEKRVGSGGFGTVYRVRDHRFHDVPKALKIIHRRHAQDRIAMDRFQQEAQLLFDLGKRSTAIVQFYDFEEDPQEGLFYFAMEWVEGKSLTQVLIQEEKLPLARALPIVRQLCQALQVAHRRGVIHRDLKPDNLMLVEEDGQEEIKVLDFGIAKALAGHWGERKFTETFLGMPGTGGYAAPEQVEARPQDIGPPTDLFAVGVILYNLLTGRDPWLGRRIADLGQFTRADELRLLNRVLDAPAIPPRQWNPELPPGLERLLLKLLQKRPQDRFQSTAELDQALQQVGQPALQPPLPPVEAKRVAAPPRPRLQPPPPAVAQPSTEPVLRGARNAVISVLLVAALAAAGVLAWRLLTAGRPTKPQAVRLEPAQPTEEPPEPRSEPPTERPPETTTPETPPPRQPPTKPSEEVETQPPERSEETAPPTRPPIRVVPNFDLTRTLTDHTDTVYAVVFSPDGRWLASGSGDNSVKLWDVATGRQVRVLLGHVAFVGGVAFSPDGRWLASAGGFKDHTVKLWEVATGREVRTLRGHTDTVWTVAFSPDGRWLASAGNDGTIMLWEVATGRELHTLQGHTQPIMSVVFSPDGRWLVSGSYDDTIKLWDVATGTEVRTVGRHPGSTWEVAFSPDGRWLASGGRDKRIKLWEVGTWREVRVLRGHVDEVKTVAFSPDGRWLASGSGDKTVKLWEVATGREVRTLTGHTDWVQAVAFSPDGRWLASGSGDKTVKLWRREE